MEAIKSAISRYLAKTHLAFNYPKHNIILSMISFSEMFSKSLTSLVILLILTLSSTAQDKKSKELDKFIAAGMADWQIPGLAVTVVQDGKTLFTKVYGVKNQNKADKVDENTIFCMASTTKAVVAIAMAMLVDEGKIKWTDKVIDHVPYFQLADAHVTREATVKDLLTHNLGLGNADLLWFGDDLDAQETINRMKYSPAAYSLRSSFIYQNIMIE